LVAGAGVVTRQGSEGTNTGRWRRDIQGLRAVAVVLVVLFHAGIPVPGGFTGVDVFFVISGFVITGMLTAELTASGRIDFSRFYRRRVRRLLPALALMVTAAAALGTFASPVVSQKTAGVTGFFASVFAANAYLYRWSVVNGVTTAYFSVDATLNPFLHTWTLAVEEQFYLVFPTVLFFAWRPWRRAPAAAGARTSALLAIAAVSVGSFVLSLYFSRGGTFGPVTEGTGFAFYGSPTRAWEFGAGAMLALASPFVARLPGAAATALGIVGAAVLVYAAFTIHQSDVFPGVLALLPVGGACLLLAAGTVGANAVSWVLSRRPAVWIGDLSYSWYLWHWPLIVYAKALWPATAGVAAAAAALSLAPAWLSYRFVENPIRLDSRIQGRRVVALAAVCIAVPVVACGGLIAVQRTLSTNATVEQFLASKQAHADEVRDCNSPTPLDRRTGSACNWDVPAAKGRIVLVGDSNAGHFTEPVVLAGNRAGYDVTVATHNQCPFVRVLMVIPSHHRVAGVPCTAFVAGTMRALIRLRPSLVIVSNAPTRYVEDPQTAFGTLDGRRLTHDTGAKARLWAAGLQSVVDRLHRAGIPVLLVRQIPAVPQYDGCAVIRVLAGTCGATVPRKVADAELSQTLHAEIAATPGTPALSVENALCDAHYCYTQRGRTLMYHDTTHLSIDGALSMTNSFERAILANARNASLPSSGTPNPP